MAYQNLILEHAEAGKVAVLTVNRPKALNALNAEILDELLDAFARLADDKEARVLLVTGAGEKAFIAGADIATMQNMSGLEAQAFSDDWTAIPLMESDAQIDRITYDDLPGDNELVTRLAPPFKTAADTARVAGFLAQLKSWPPSHLDDPAENIRHLVSLATVADITADLREAEIARAVFDELRARFDRDTLRRVLAWIILNPDDGTVVTKAPELGVRRHPPERLIRERLPLYAKKYLGRVLGKIRD